MSTQPPSTPDQVAQAVNAHVREIMATAERAAAELRAEVEGEALRLAAQIRADAERDAQRIRDDARAAAEAHLQDALARVQAFADGRITRLDELAGDLLAKAEAIDVRLDEAVGLRRELEDLVSALRAAARRATAEAGRPPIRLPQPPAGEPGTVPPPELPARPSLDDPDVPPGAEVAVREVARDLPRPPRPIRGRPAPPPPLPGDPAS